MSHKADLCASALTEARRLIAVRVYGPLLSRLLARARELLDDVDEVLIGLDRERDHQAFARAAALRHEIDAVQSLVPREGQGKSGS